MKAATRVGRSQRAGIWKRILTSHRQATVRSCTSCDLGDMRDGQPHELLKLPDYREIRTAVVIVSFNELPALRVTLGSLVRAKNQTPFRVFLVENGSGADTKSLVIETVRYMARAGLDIRYIDSPRNLGFSGGNNLGIKEALAEDFSHICLLNSDVVCTTGWLDHLIASGELAVGPVANAVGNEQTVIVNYTAPVDDSAFEIADAFAQRWANNFEPTLVKTDFLGFFCVPLSRVVIDRVGYLDERFYPGSYEDDDYCLRLAQAGFEMAIARHVYVHHFGSSSFSTLDLSERVRIGDKNRFEFERKWGRRWSDRTHLPLLSVEQDSARFSSATEREELLRSMLRGAGTQYSKLTKDLMAAVEHYRSEIAKRDDQIQCLQGVLMDDELTELARIRTLKFPQRIGFGSCIAELPGEGSVEVRRAYTTLLLLCGRGLLDREFVSADVFQGIQPIIYELAAAFASDTPVLVLTGHGVDPIEGDERDGYVQRVMATDIALADRHRIYLKVDESFRRNPSIVRLLPDLWRLEIADRDELGEAILQAVVKAGVGIYSHSLFGVGARSVQEVIRRRTGKFFLDLHGVIPEEYEMCDDPFTAQESNDREAEIAEETDRIICVSSRMAEHFVAKYPGIRHQPIICPIFVEAEVLGPEQHVYNARPRVVYAGGTQKWQQIGKMLDIIVDSRHHAEFVICTPKPDLILRELVRRSLDPKSEAIISRSATHPEILKIYEECDFGFLLRQESVVNRVACPTKLIEYLMYGIIPILDSASGRGFRRSWHGVCGLRGIPTWRDPFGS